MTTHLADVFLLVVSAQVTICNTSKISLLSSVPAGSEQDVPTFELLPDIRQLFVDALFFELAGSRVPEIGDELD